MAVSISAVVLLGLLVFIFVKKAGLNVAHAIVCVLFGFFLAGSSAAPSIGDGVQNVIQLIGRISF
ncbi:hypothetical protein [Streptomyces sp. TRM49041]|uniref:hypothetical protein n=1 Tax=Streptomyces sp. TRM49041 TaxID=2603216 RepID=UPI0011EEC7C0|nr:hypothetical protein [Streptomyces sp. TRM49041]